ncbi:MAG: phosphotransferase [Actinomycetota bacterium]
MTKPTTRGLDPDWVAAQLANDGTSPTATFDGFIGTGQIGRNARYRLDWHGGTGPATVVVKLPAADAGVRQIGFDQGLYPKECTFYRELVDLVDVVTPAPLAVDIDPEALDFALVLQDMAGSEAGDQFTEATDEQLALAVEQAAALHGPLWGKEHPALDAIRGDDADRGSTRELIGLFLPGCLDRLGDRLDEHTVPVLERFVELADVWVERPVATPSLLHSDFRPDNFLFGHTDDAPPLAVVDWQTVTVGASVSDVAYLLGAAIDPVRRRAVEHDLLVAYRTHLAAYDVDYPEDVCWNEYATGSLHGIVVGILATIMATETERGNDLFALMLNRHARHVLDVDALDLVGDLG